MGNSNNQNSLSAKIEEQQRFIRGNQGHTRLLRNIVPQELEPLRTLLLADVAHFGSQMRAKKYEQQSSKFSLLLYENSGDNLFGLQSKLGRLTQPDNLQRFTFEGFIRNFEFAEQQLHDLGRLGQAFTTEHNKQVAAQNWKNLRVQYRAFRNSILHSLSQMPNFVFFQLAEHFNYHFLYTYDHKRRLTSPGRRFPPAGRRRQRTNLRNADNMEEEEESQALPLTLEECKLVIKQFAILINLLCTTLQYLFGELFDLIIPENIWLNFCDPLVFKEMFFRLIAEQFAFSEKFRIRVIVMIAIDCYRKHSQFSYFSAASIIAQHVAEGQQQQLENDLHAAGTIQHFSNLDDPNSYVGGGGAWREITLVRNLLPKCDALLPSQFEKAIFKRIERILVEPLPARKVTKIIKFGAALTREYQNAFSHDSKQMKKIENMDERAPILHAIFYKFFAIAPERLPELQKLHFILNVYFSGEFDLLSMDTRSICQSLYEFKEHLEKTIQRIDEAILSQCNF